jgi:hypothetical protein
MDFGIFYEIQVNSPLKHREREYQAFHDVMKQVVRAEEVGGHPLLDRRASLPGRLCPCVRA